MKLGFGVSHFLLLGLHQLVGAPLCWALSWAWGVLSTLTELLVEEEACMAASTHRTQQRSLVRLWRREARHVGDRVAQGTRGLLGLSPSLPKTTAVHHQCKGCSNL